MGYRQQHRGVFVPHVRVVIGLLGIALFLVLISPNRSTAATANPRDASKCMPPCCVTVETPTGNVVRYRCFQDRDFCRLQYVLTCLSTVEQPIGTPVACAEDITMSDLYCRLGTYLNDQGCSPAAALSAACQTATAHIAPAKEIDCMAQCMTTCPGGQLGCQITVIVSAQ